MFRRLRAALASWIAPTPAPAPAPEVGIPHPDDYATGAEFYAAVKEAARNLSATTNRVSDVRDQGTAVQARDIRSLSTGDTHHTDTHHHGTVHYGTGDITSNSPTHYGTGDQVTGTVTNNNNGGNVGMQLGHVNSGILNVGGSNTFRNTTFGNTNVNNHNHIGQNNGQAIQGGDVHGGINFNTDR